MVTIMRAPCPGRKPVTGRSDQKRKRRCGIVDVPASSRPLLSPYTSSRPRRIPPRRLKRRFPHLLSPSGTRQHDASAAPGQARPGVSCRRPASRLGADRGMRRPVGNNRRRRPGSARSRSWRTSAIRHDAARRPTAVDHSGRPTGESGLCALDPRLAREPHAVIQSVDPGPRSSRAGRAADVDGRRPCPGSSRNRAAGMRSGWGSSGGFFTAADSRANNRREHRSRQPAATNGAGELYLPSKTSALTVVAPFSSSGSTSPNSTKAEPGQLGVRRRHDCCNRPGKRVFARLFCNLAVCAGWARPRQARVR